MFAMFDVLGFSNWLKTAGLPAVLDAYHQLIEKVVVPTSENGGLSAVQTSEGAIFAVTGPPGYAYFSDTILLWHPLVPPFVDDFIGRCGDLVCEALAMNIPLRGALTLGDAVLSSDADFYLGEPIVEATKLEKAQNWMGLTFGNTAVWSSFLVQMHGTSIIEYDPPTKEHLREFASPIVLDWPRKWRDKFGQCPTAKLRELNTDPRFSLYWENTIAFAEYSLKKHDWHLRPDEIPPNALLRLVSRKDAGL
ncbi:hypothetical protein GCM10028785_27240 [Hydrogenophaga soli]